MCSDGIGWPLTPALSQRERERETAALDASAFIGLTCIEFPDAGSVARFFSSPGSLASSSAGSAPHGAEPLADALA